MGIPAIGIFAPTPHERYGPYFSRELTVSCEEDLGCNPCFAGKKLMACGVYNQTTPCMDKITVEAVYQSVLKVIMEATR
jgi:ADP-heptose:LPS heptosyltransferase